MLHAVMLMSVLCFAVHSASQELSCLQSQLVQMISLYTCGRNAAAAEAEFDEAAGRLVICTI